MKNILKLSSIILLSLLYVMPMAAQQQVTGLSGVKLFLDPGHSGKENQGLYGYSEAEKTLRVALAMKEYLLTHTDIDTVYMCRTTDNEIVDLDTRSDMANALDADFFYSIHSDASGDASTNTTLTMYGGWKTNGVVVEKTPNGGKAFGDILCADITGVMRLATRGNMADRTYYDSANNHDNKYPYLSVNRRTNMASILSEAAFHTNPFQQQRNLNAEYKRTEGLSAFRSFLEYMNVERPVIGVVTGVVKDSETGLAVNGATITVNGKTYTTDSYESLFKKHSKDPNELRNGFYFFEGLTPGQTYDVTFSSPEFQPLTKSVTIVSNPTGRTAENFSWLDVQLVNSVPAKVAGVNAEDLSSVIIDNPLTIKFSREMDAASVESAISIDPTATISYTWTDKYTLNINIQNLGYKKTYNLTLKGDIAKNAQTSQKLDGNGDGVEGGDYVLTFTTAEIDTDAPVVVSFDPAKDGVATVARPFIRIEFDEALVAESILADHIILKDVSGTPITGVVKHNVVNKKSVLHLMLTEDLLTEETYNLEVKGGLKDRFGNATTAWTSSFTTNLSVITEDKMIDAFDTTVATWWGPAASGSTTGVAPATTAKGNSVVVATENSTGSAELIYEWEYTSGKPHFIRWYVPAAASKAKGTFDIRYVLKVDVFGDGSGTLMRFNIVDGSGKYEATKYWTPIDWIGWRTVEWDLTKGEAVGWVNGNGVLDPRPVGGPVDVPFYMDSFQFQDSNTSATGGTLYIDNFRAVIESPGVVGIGETGADSDIDIRILVGQIQVNAESNIQNIAVFGLNGQQIAQVAPDAESYTMNVTGLAKGVYIVKVKTNSSQKVAKIIVR